MISFELLPNRLYFQCRATDSNGVCAAICQCRLKRLLLGSRKTVEQKSFSFGFIFASTAALVNSANNAE